jgi:hypothetical protein
MVEGQAIIFVYVLSNLMERRNIKFNGEEDCNGEEEDEEVGVGGGPEVQKDCNGEEEDEEVGVGGGG